MRLSDGATVQVAIPAPQVRNVLLVKGPPGPPGGVDSVDGQQGAVDLSGSYVGKGELLFDVRDFGATPGVDNTAAFQSAIDAAAANGGRVFAGGVNVTYRVDGLVKVKRRVEMEVPAGVTIQKPAAATSSDPVLRLNGNDAKLVGGGRVESLKPCPNGVVAVAPDTTGLVEWCYIAATLQVVGSDTTGDIGVLLSGTSTFQNRVDATVSAVDVGVQAQNGANANQFGCRMFNINQYAYRMVSTIENGVVGGSVLASPGVTVLKLESTQYTRVMGLVAEPGAGATFYNIDSGCTDVHILGVVNNTASLGTDAGTGTVKILNNGLYAGRNLVIGGGTPITKHLAGSGVLDFPAIAPGGSASLTVTVPGAATGDDATCHAQSAAGFPAGLVAAAIVTAADTVTIRLTNVTGASIDPPGGATWRVHVWRF